MAINIENITVDDLVFELGVKMVENLDSRKKIENLESTTTTKEQYENLVKQLDQIKVKNGELNREVVDLRQQLRDKEQEIKELKSKSTKTTTKSTGKKKTSS